MPLQRVGRLLRVVLVGVDPVVDDRDPLLGDVEVGEDVVLRALRHRDDGVGHLERRPLHPRRGVVTAAELLPFPRAERLQRVDGNHERDAVGELGEDPAEVGVPRVAVDDVGRDGLGNEPDRTTERSEHGPQLLRGSRQVMGDREAADLQRALARVLRAEGPDVDVDELRQLACQVLDVDARAAVDVRRVLVGQDQRVKCIAHVRFRCSVSPHQGSG